MWLNEYHADFLARDRLAEVRRAAARHHLLDSLRRQSGGHRMSVASMIATVGRRLRAICLRSRARWLPAAGRR